MRRSALIASSSGEGAAPEEEEEAVAFAASRRTGSEARRRSARRRLRDSFATIRSNQGRNGASPRYLSSVAWAFTNASCTASSPSAPASSTAVRCAIGV